MQSNRWIYFSLLTGIAGAMYYLFRKEKNPENQKQDENQHVPVFEKKQNIQEQQYQRHERNQQVNLLSQSLIQNLKQLVDNEPIIDINLQNYIKEKLEKVKMEQNYNIRNLQTKINLAQHCDSMIPVRGDGNSFYTAFGFQFIKLLINDTNYLEMVKQNYSNIKMKLNKNGYSLIEDPQKEEQLRKSFFDRIDYFSSMENEVERNKKFEEHFAAFEENENEEDLVDGFFNVLTVIFMRNLSNYLVEQSDIRDLVFDKENLLIWEKECNNNEPIISLLAKHLKLKVKVLMFENSNFILLEYRPENKYTIILLMKPGHYNIGIKN